MLSMPDSPTVRVRRYAQSKHWLYGNVETQRGPRIKVDLYHAWDFLLLAGDGCEVPAGEPTLVAVQVTSASNRSRRWKRLASNNTVPHWLADGTRGGALVTTGTKKPRGGKPIKVIRWTTLGLSPSGELVQVRDDWYEG